MTKSIAILLFSVAFILKVNGQDMRSAISIHLSDDAKTVTVSGTLRWEIPKDSLPERIWLEIWPIALGAENSVIAEQWLEDQQTKFHFSKEEDRLLIKNLQFQAASDAIPFKRGRSPELLSILRDSVYFDGGSAIQLNFSYSIILPEDDWASFGNREDGILLQNWIPRFSYLKNRKFHPSPMNRTEDRNLTPTLLGLTLDLPPFFFPISSLSEVTEFSDFNRSFDEGQFNFLQHRRTHALGSGKYLGKDQILISKSMRVVTSENANSRWISTNKENLGELPSEYDNALERFKKWLSEEYQIIDTTLWTMIFTESPIPQSVERGLLFIHPNKLGPYEELSLAERYFKALVSEGLASENEPWLSSGLSNYMAHTYMEATYPGISIGGPFEKTLIARFFRVNELPLGYQRQLLYLYLARQGLDQVSIDSTEAYTRGTYEAEMKSKSSLQLNYLHDFMGDRKFRYGISQYLNRDQKSAKVFEEAMSKASPYRPVDWYFDDLISNVQPLDIKLHKAEDCPSLFVVTTSARKGNSFPYSTSGFIGDSLVMTEWFEPHIKKAGKNFYKANYTRVEVADPLRYPDLFGKNNSRKTSGLFKMGKPLELQLYTSLENPNKNQIYWLPKVSFNAYDEVLLGVNFYNTTLIPKKFEYRIGPQYSTGTNELVGFASVRMNFPLFEGNIRQITGGMYYRTFHYAPNLAYNRFSPAITLRLRKSDPRSPYIRKILFRNVYVDLEVPSESDAQVGESGYTVFNVRYTSEFTSILRPRTLRIDWQTGDFFSKVSAEWDQRWMLPNRKWMILRLFAGWMPYNNNPNGVDLFDFGISGTQDYLFDYYFIGRSDESGIWSQQFFATDGGFRTNLNQYGRNHIVAANFSLPIYSVLGVYGDVGTIGGPVEWGYGIRIALLTDFLEWYFPLQSRGTDHYEQFNYLSQTRFVLDLDLDAIINRLRRGFY
jgi:hypothetical protein